MSSIRVNQAVSLTTVYQTPEVQPQKADLNGRVVEQRTDGHSRVDASKSQFQRFVSRTKHSFSRFADIFCSSDRAASREADRFNHRHEKFSGRVQHLVSLLKSGNETQLSNPAYVATLRNDVKLMNRDMPWAARGAILEKRMDVELSKLSDEELDQVRRGLSEVDDSGLTTKDKNDLRTLRLSVVRQEVARSETLHNLLKHFATSETSDKDDEGIVKDLLSQVQDHCYDAAAANDDVLKYAEMTRMIRDAVGIALRRSPELGQPDSVAKMNVAFLNLKPVFEESFNEIQDQYHADLDDNNSVSSLSSAIENQYLDAEMDMGCLRELGKGIRDEYIRLMTPEQFTDKHLFSRLTTLGQGAAHVVSKGAYELSNDPQVSMKTHKVHKYDDESIRQNDSVLIAPDLVKIDHDDPRLLERSVFTSRVNDLLELNVCVKTDFAHHHDTNGIVMDLASGTTAGSFVGGAKTDGAALKRSLCALQLLDCVTGQTDRHLGNYMVQLQDDGHISGVTAVDNDVCMGKKRGTLLDIAGRGGIHYLGPPPVIDKTMAAAVAKLTPEKLEELTAGMFSSEEIAALKDRVADLQAKIADQRIVTIDDGEWESPRVKDLLNQKQVVQRTGVDGSLITREIRSSYWGRDQAYLAEIHFSLLM